MEILYTVVLTVFSFFYMLLIAKLMGHRQISQLNAFDYITGITVGSIAADLATQQEQAAELAVAMGLYGLLTLFMSMVTLHWPRSRKFVEGTPTILYHNGKLYRENFKKAKLDLGEFQTLCRQQGYFDLSQVYSIVFEHTGALSILPVERHRPMTPEDAGLSPQQSAFFTEVIMDGRVMGENLKRMGKEMRWLQKQLEAQGYHSPKEIFLGLCDQNDTLTLYPPAKA